MASRPRSSEKTSIGNRLVLWLTAAVIISMYLAFGRLVSGSWRQFAAVVLAAVTYLVGMAVLERLLHPQSAEDWRRMTPAFPFVGALAGGTYVLVSTASGFVPAIVGFAWGLLHAWLVWRQARRVAAEVHAEPTR